MPQFDITVLLSQASFAFLFASTYLTFLKIWVPYISFFSKVQSKELIGIVLVNNMLFDCYSSTCHLEFLLYTCSILNSIFIFYVKKNIFSFSLILL